MVTGPSKAALPTAGGAERGEREIFRGGRVLHSTFFRSGCSPFLVWISVVLVLSQKIRLIH